MLQEPMLPTKSEPTNAKMPSSENANIVQNAPAEVNAWLLGSP